MSPSVLFRHATVIAILGLATMGCAPRNPAYGLSKDASPLTQLMIKRLEISREVAWSKLKNNIPIRDRERERQLLSDLVAQGVLIGVPAWRVEEFFGAQIDASCEAQSEWLRTWKRGGTLPTYPPKNLTHDIRPQLDAISTEMLRELAHTEGFSAPERASARAALRTHGFSWRVAALATRKN